MTLIRRKIVQDITMRDIEELRIKRLRPGIKALFYNGKTGDVLLGRLPSGGTYPRRYNLPGGGIDPRQSAKGALQRELEEEINGRIFKKSFLQTLPVVAEGYLPFIREDFSGKYEFIVAIALNDLTIISPKPQSKLELLPVMPWVEASKMVHWDIDCVPEMRSLYVRAIQAVPELLD